MMNNAWKINDGNKTYGKGWASESPGKSAAQGAPARGGAAAGGRPGTA